MSRKSLEILIEKSIPLLKQYGKLSTAYLMRKFRIDYEEATKIMWALGLPTYITAEEYHENGMSKT